MGKPRLALFALLVVGIVLGMAAAPAMAAHFDVNSTSDAPDNSVDGTCDTAPIGQPPNGQCTLRAAIEESNQLSDPDDISLPPGTYQLTRAGSTPDNEGVDDDLDVFMGPVTIKGTGGARVTTIIGPTGSFGDRIFDVHASPAGGSLTLSGVTLTGGNTIDPAPDDGGGAIKAEAPTTLTNVAVTTNDAGIGRGGGAFYVAPGGELHLDGVLVSGNTALGATRNGGGILNDGGLVTTVNTTFSGNTAGNFGGAIADTGSSPTTTVSSTTFSGNEGRAGGASIRRGTSTGKFNVSGSILTSDAPNCSILGTLGVSSGGGNVAHDTSCTFTATGDIQGVDPLLGPLQDNGGPTDTQLPGVGSPAIDRVPTGPSCPGTDQRGTARPLGTACDSGAVEAPAPVVPPPPPPPPPGPNDPSSIVLDPHSAQREPGDKTPVTATVRRQDGSLAVGVQARYVVTGANPVSGLSTTDAGGQAAIVWDGAHDGTDTLTAFLDLNGNGTQDVGEPADVATVKWVLPVPTVAKTVNIDPISGVVLVKLPPGATLGKRDPSAHAAASFVPLEEAHSIPVGSFVDTRRGTVELTSAIKKGSTKTQRGQFFSGLFQIKQENATRPFTELRMTESLTCPKRKGKLTASRARSRKLWGRDAGGHFRTRGRHSSASVRGTEWLTKDTCTTTTTVVRQGAVDVKDFAKGKTVRVKAGRRYVARARKRR